jgi:hypothetical protein
MRASLAATKPAPGARINVGAADVQAYLAYLDSRQSAVSASVPAAHITHRYNVVFNGFSALLKVIEVDTTDPVPLLRSARPSKPIPVK